MKCGIPVRSWPGRAWNTPDRADDGVGALVECGLHLRPGELIEDDCVGQWRSSR